MTIGIDEVGRGCLAGPLLVVAAKAKSELPEGTLDSKLLSRNQRQKILSLLIDVCDIGEGWVSSKEIDKLGLSKAMKLAVARALINLKSNKNDKIIIDGHINYCPDDYELVECVIGGDKLVPIVSAASIIAKVTRDNFMLSQSKKYPNWGFDKHVGYGTKLHMEAITKYGICDLHRRSFKPIKQYV